jgi:hypothetical protein
MLLPEKRIARNGVEGIIVIGAKRPELDKLPFQDRLIIEFHLC